MTAPPEPRALSLGAGEIHIWSAAVAAHVSRESALGTLLDRAEAERAERFRFARDRTQFVVAHGLLRRLLGAYLGCEPALPRFEVGSWGKPELAPEFRLAADRLRFSLSHAGDRVLLAFARERRVGVDVERCVPGIATDELAATCFSPAELATFRALPSDAKERAFFAGWTRKEAYIKALGVGVSHGLAYFDVALEPDSPARLIDDRLFGLPAAGWTMRDLGLQPDYAGAVVFEGRAGIDRRTLEAGAFEA